MAVFEWMSQPLKLTTVLDPVTYTPPPCEHEGHFLENSSMGAMEWGVTGGSIHSAAASQETRHRVARARGQFQDTSSMGAMEWGGAEAHKAGLVIVNLAACKGCDSIVDVHASSL